MASSVIGNVLVVGAGGNLGPSIVEALDADPQFVVSILARQSSKSAFPSHLKVHRVDGSYPENELLEAFRGQDAVVCATSVTSVLQQLKLIDAAVKAGVKRFIPAEFGGNKEHANAKNGEPIPLQDEKNAVWDHLKARESENFSWTAVATGPFFDWGLRNGFLGFDLKARLARIYGSGDEQWTGTTLSTIGLAVSRTLQRPEETRNKFIYIYSISTSQNQVLEALRTVTGVPWEVDRVSMEASIQDGRRKLEAGDRAGVVPLILSYFFGDGMGANYAKDVEAANRLLELPEENLIDLVRAAVL